MEQKPRRKKQILAIAEQLIDSYKVAPLSITEARNNMDEKQKKQYVANSIKLDSGKRIAEVLLRYWKDRGLKNSPKNDIIKEAKELFA